MKSDGFLQFSMPILLSLTLRSAVLLHPYSGQGKPPMYGDYEAQRHWMEITTNLPLSEWYFNSTTNDLNYWGLDYPPLTAYHSWVMGSISHQVNPNWTQLTSSRGVESPEHKMFMRYTVIVSDMLTFMPAVLYYFYVAFPAIPSESKISPFYSCCLTLLYPGLILIDHGHFQYNCVSLGLFIFALGLFLRDEDIFATVIFCLSLSYKQMELYHSLPMFFYLLGKCLNSPCPIALIRLMKLSLTVILTLSVVFSPFLLAPKALFQVMHRLFPVARGLYEDKVANVWCVTSPLIKWSTLFTQADLVKLCITCVTLSSFPSCLALLFRPTKHRLLFSLASTSMAFFLFSYQVHEKSILLVAIPAFCILPLSSFPSFLFAITSTLSMWPLFLKDQLVLSSICTLTIFLSLGLIVVLRPYTSESPKPSSTNRLLGFLIAVIFGYLVIFLLQAIWNPPKAYPDLFALLVSTYSCAQFLLFFLYWNYKVFTTNGV